MLKWLFTTIVILLPLIVSLRLQAQSDFYIGAEIGYATFSMDKLKDNQETQRYYLPVPAKTVDDFSGYMQYAFNFTGQKASHLYGATIGHTSTGGRISYMDYSGSLIIDNSVSMSYLGGTAAWCIIQEKDIALFAGVNLSLYVNTLKKRVEEIVGDVIITDDLKKWYSSNLAVGPYIEAQRRLGRFVFRAQASYEFHFQGELNYSEQGIAFSIFPFTNNGVDAGGLRLKAGVNYRLKRVKKGD